MLFALACATIPAHASESIHVGPAAIVLDNPEATQQVVVWTSTADFTRTVDYRMLDPKIAIVEATGLVRPVGDGKTTLVILRGKEETRVPVEVSGLRTPPLVDFRTQIIPLFSKAGCNMGGCHGKAEGKNGFKLSIFGFDPASDFASITKESRGRRILPSAPDDSLLLRKGSGRISHGGGRRLPPDSLAYHRLRRWIAEGARFEAEAAPIVGIEVEPRERVLQPHGTQQLRVTAIDAAGHRRCVTTSAKFDSNAPSIARPDSSGLIQASDIPGQAAILVRFLDYVTSCRVVLPQTERVFDRPAEATYIDRRAWDNLERLGIPAAERADDATFLRRVYLDTIGTLPTAAEARAFLTDKSPGKRARLIDRLLDRPEYSDYWTMLWSDLLRVDRDAITPAGAVAFTRWLKKQFAENRPYDEFVRTILTARGSISDEGPAALYKALQTPEEMSRSFSQVFFGVRIQCAQCHHHPSDRWGQDDYFALAGFFTGVQRKPLPGGGEAIVAKKGTDLPHPRTAKPIPARALGAEPADFAKHVDRRAVLADWLIAPGNPYFTRAAVNRLWAHYFSRGLVEPLDDMRATNPASNEPLLDDLARHFRNSKYDVKEFTRTLLNSRVYQLAGRPPGSKVIDEQNFSSVAPKAMPAEVLLDALSQATGVPEKFNGWPAGYRAIQLWDNRVPSYFFRIFGRPVRASVCECERSNEPSIAQALHLMNSEEIADKIHTPTGTARRLARSKKTPAEIIDELYLTTLTRFPSESERASMLRVFAEAGADRQGATEDALWALVNSRGFVYNH
ncbi:MAG TPA: DUF1549 domain-containing protein [Gemmataceae bacterium]|nr:DUF1549 domain-containing protein [Gemmataceae bacterium]